MVTVVKVPLMRTLPQLAAVANVQFVPPLIVVDRISLADTVNWVFPASRVNVGSVAASDDCMTLAVG
jgi:hypothetical protein